MVTLEQSQSSVLLFAKAMTNSLRKAMTCYFLKEPFLDNDQQSLVTFFSCLLRSLRYSLCAHSNIVICNVDAFHVISHFLPAFAQGRRNDSGARGSTSEKRHQAPQASKSSRGIEGS